MDRSKIYIIYEIQSTVKLEFGDKLVYGRAIAEDGTIVGRWCSSSVSMMKQDMGLTSNNQHDQYAEHYPEGYELVLVEKPWEDNPGLVRALEIANPTFSIRDHVEMS